MALKEASKVVRKEIADELSRLGLNRVKPRKESVLTPIAVTVENYNSVLSSEKIFKDISIKIVQLAAYSKQVHIIASLQMQYGLRISELLKLRHSNITKNGQILIKGLKHSNDRIIHPGEHLDFFLKCSKSFIDPFRDISYMFIYRTYKKFGICSYLNVDSKMKVTHLPRHLVISDLRTAGISNEVTGTFIGHKDKKNTLLYGKHLR